MNLQMIYILMVAGYLFGDFGFALSAKPNYAHPAEPQKDETNPHVQYLYQCLRGIWWSVWVHLPIIIMGGMPFLVISWLMHALVHALCRQWTRRFNHRQMIVEQFIHFLQVCIIFIVYMRFSGYLGARTYMEPTSIYVA